MSRRIPFGTLSRFMNRLPRFMQNNKFGTTTTKKLAQSVELSVGYSTIVETDPEDALLITARTEDGDYRLILDIDGEFDVRKSSGSGSHLFFNTRMTKEQHDAVIWALLDAGVIQNAWGRSAIASPLGATLRPPWVVKGTDHTLRQQVGWLCLIS